MWGDGGSWVIANIVTVRHRFKTLNPSLPWLHKSGLRLSLCLSIVYNSGATLTTQSLCLISEPWDHREAEAVDAVAVVLEVAETEVAAAVLEVAVLVVVVEAVAFVTRAHLPKS